MPSTFQPQTEMETRAAGVDLYPTVGRRMPGESAWEVMVQGRIFRPWHDNIRRRLVLQLLRRTMRISTAEMKSELLEERLNDFWIKPCRNRRVTVKVDGEIYALRKRSRGSGHFQSPIRVPFAKAQQSDDQPGRLIISADHHIQTDPPAAYARLIPPCGTSVISDIDDTIKVSDVLDRRRMFANAFLHKYSPVTGMAELYRNWAGQGCEFHYVSSSPWQLFRPLDSFFNECGLPAGSFHLRPFRLRDPKNFQLKLAGTRSKRKAIRSLLKWYPFRQFILIGDGGEKDAKLYGKIAMKHGHQIAQICIRRLPGATNEADRAVRFALRELPPSKWRLFDDAAELTDFVAGNRLGWKMS